MVSPPLTKQQEEKLAKLSGIERQREFSKIAREFGKKQLRERRILLREFKRKKERARQKFLFERRGGKAREEFERFKKATIAERTRQLRSKKIPKFRAGVTQAQQKELIQNLKQQGVDIKQAGLKVKFGTVGGQPVAVAKQKILTKVKDIKKPKPFLPTEKLSQKITKAQESKFLKELAKVKGTGAFSAGVAQGLLGVPKVFLDTITGTTKLATKQGRKAATTAIKTGAKTVGGLKVKDIKAAAKLAKKSATTYIKTTPKKKLFRDISKVTGQAIGSAAAFRVASAITKAGISKKPLKIKPKVERTKLSKQPIGENKEITEKIFKSVIDFGKAGKLKGKAFQLSDEAVFTTTKGTLKLGSIRLPKVTKRALRKAKVEFGKKKPITIKKNLKSASVQIGDDKILTIAVSKSITNKQLIKLGKDALKKASKVSKPLQKAISKKGKKPFQKLLKKPTKKQPLARTKIKRREARVIVSREIQAKRLKRQIALGELQVKGGGKKGFATKEIPFKQLRKFADDDDEGRRIFLRQEKLKIKLGKKQRKLKAKKLGLDITAQLKTAPIKRGKITVINPKNIFSNQQLITVDITNPKGFKKLMKLAGIEKKLANIKGKSLTNKKAAVKDVSKALPNIPKQILKKQFIKAGIDKKIINDIFKRRARIPKTKQVLKSRKEIPIKKKAKTQALLSANVAAFTTSTVEEARSVIRQAVQGGTISIDKTSFKLGSGRAIPLPPSLKNKTQQEIIQSNKFITVAKSKLKDETKLKQVLGLKFKPKAKLKLAQAPLTKTKIKTIVTQALKQPQLQKFKFTPAEKSKLKLKLTQQITQKFKVPPPVTTPSKLPVPFIFRFGGATIRIPLDLDPKKKKRKRRVVVRKGKRKPRTKVKPSLAPLLRGEKTRKKQKLVGLLPRKIPIKARRKRRRKR